VTDWTPASEAEVAMRDALANDDQELYFRILARVELLLPVSSDAIAGRAPMGWGTWTAGERTHVLAFTSSEAMHACLAEHAGSARRIPFHELAAGWPDLEWWLAVNPGLPIEGYLPAWFVSQLARGDARLPGRGAQARAERAETLERGRAGLPSRRRRGGVVGDGGTGGTRGEQAPAPPPSEPPSEPPPSGPPPSEPSPSAPQGPQVAQLWPEGSPEPLPLTRPVAADIPPAGSGAAGTAAVDLTPANDLESELLAAAVGDSGESPLSILLLAKVLLPVADGADAQLRPGDEGFVWRTEEIDGRTCVVAFTSDKQLAAHLDASVEALGVRFVQLIRTWPDTSWSLVVNPDTVIAVILRGAQITALASSAAEVGLDDHAGEARDAGMIQTGRMVAAVVEQPPIMQKAIAPSQVPWYLERGYDRVSGFVHRGAEVAHLRTPAQLVSGLGLRHDGSPFDPGADDVYVLRWPAYVPSLYRIPYGGRTEAAMTAMEGWVIERPPFRGNGFAPADSGDVIAEFKVDSVRLPHGAELWQLRADGTSRQVARLDADGPVWQPVEEG
jgi:hypothetical protein